MIGSRLGPYELIEEIGPGAMATVYRAYQPTMDRYMALDDPAQPSCPTVEVSSAGLTDPRIHRPFQVQAQIRASPGDPGPLVLPHLTVAGWIAATTSGALSVSS